MYWREARKVIGDSAARCSILKANGCPRILKSDEACVKIVEIMTRYKRMDTARKMEYRNEVAALMSVLPQDVQRALRTRMNYLDQLDRKSA
jgi:hypothetical protein